MFTYYPFDDYGVFFHDKFSYLFIYSFLAVLGLCCSMGFYLLGRVRASLQVSQCSGLSS